MTKKNKDLVVITNQSFKKAGGTDTFPGLEPCQTVMVCTYKHSYTREYLLRFANEELSAKAIEKGYTHVFGVESEYGYFHGQHPSNGLDLQAIGTGYKLK